MKTTKIYRFLSFIIIAFTTSSCIEDGEYSLPNITIEETNITANSSITAVKEALKQEYNANNKLIYTFREGNDLFIEGYVISSDAAGNFYKKIMIQDHAENPSAGIEILVNKVSLSETYGVGRKIQVLLDGLSVSYDDGGNNENFSTNDDINPANTVAGKYILGALEGDRVGNIPSTNVAEHLKRTAIVKEIIPTKITLTEISGAHINTMVQLSNVQFLKNNLGKTFSGEANDEFDGFRSLFECDTEKRLPLQTSTFASFKSNVIPTGKGTASFILSKDYRSEFLVAIANTPADLVLTSIDRCDPIVLECTTISGGGNAFFSENFESFNGFTSEGWENINIDNTNTDWFLSSFSGNKYAQISAYNSGNIHANVWLVTPPIEMENTTGEELLFDLQANFDNGTNLSVYITSNYTGDPTTTNWELLDATIPEGPSGGFGNFKTVGPINISCVDGTAHIGFLYKGADPGASTRYHLDNIRVIGN